MLCEHPKVLTKMECVPGGFSTESTLFYHGDGRARRGRPYLRWLLILGWTWVCAASWERVHDVAVWALHHQNQRYFQRDLPDRQAYHRTYFRVNIIKEIHYWFNAQETSLSHYNIIIHFRKRSVSVGVKNRLDSAPNMPFPSFFAYYTSTFSPGFSFDALFCGFWGSFELCGLFSVTSFWLMPTR